MTAIKKIFAFSLLAAAIVAVLGLALPAQADTVQEIISKISALKAQIADLEKQLYDLQHAPQPWCYAFNKNLRYDSSGRAVKELKTALAKEGLYSGVISSSSSDRFDDFVASAVVQFQQKYASEILTPFGLSYGTGYVGPATRAKLNSLYGCSPHGNLPPVISGVSGPATIPAGQAGTWSVTASDPEGGVLSYSVLWGDESMTAPEMNAYSPLANSFSQSATFTHSYASAGNYTIKFYVKDNTGRTAQTTLTVTVIP